MDEETIITRYVNIILSKRLYIYDILEAIYIGQKQRIRFYESNLINILIS